MASRAVRAALHYFKDSNILSIGIGRKISKDKLSRRVCLVFGVRQKLESLSKVPHGYRIPRSIKVPPSNKLPEFTIPTDVVIRKPKFFSNNFTSPFFGTAIQPAGSLSFGTLGAVVVDQFQNQYIVSCSHVLTDYGRQESLGQPVLLYPSGRAVAQLSRFFRIQPGFPNYADVALAKITDKSLVSANLPFSGVVGVANALPQSAITLIGASSPKGSGTVINTTVSERVFGWGGDPGAWLLMADQIETANLGQAGDSGALVKDANNRAVGLFTAHNADFDLVTPIQRSLMFASRPDTMICDSDDTNQLTLRFI